MMAVVALAGCTTSSNLAEPQIAPMLAAAQKSERALLGFTPLPSALPIRLERSSATSRGYDTMLHLAWPNRSETIGFVKVADGYKWVCDQEIHEGPREYDTADGRFHERITLSYSVPDETADVRRQNGMPPGFSATYDGPDETLRAATMQGLFEGTPTGPDAKRRLDVVLPLLVQWKNARH